MILDAQDYLDKWHLAVICKIEPKNEQECIKVNFLPYPKGNRDEWLQASELPRLSGIFTQSGHDQDKETINKNLQSMRDYVKKFISPGKEPKV